MRTEVKLGIAIGILVVAAVAGYFIFTGGSKDQPVATPPSAVKDLPPRIVLKDKPYTGSSATSAPATAPVLPPVATQPSSTIDPLASGSRRLTDSPSSTTKPSAMAGLLTMPTTPKSYTVVAGDKGYWTIAEKVYGKGNGKYYTLIQKANSGVDSSRLKVGQQLIIPPLPTEAGKASAATPAPLTVTSTGAPAGTGLFGSTPSTPAVSPSGEKEYIVKSGDTGWLIAQKELGNGTYWPLIGKANPGVDAAHLKVGQKLRIPAKPGSASGVSSAAPTPIRSVATAAPTSRPANTVVLPPGAGLRPDFGS